MSAAACPASRRNARIEGPPSRSMPAWRGVVTDPVRALAARVPVPYPAAHGSRTPQSASRGARPDALLGGSGREPRSRDRGHRGGGAPGREGRLPPGALPLALLLPDRGGGALRSRGADPGPHHRVTGEAGLRLRRRDRGLPLGAAGGRSPPQHGGGARRGRPPRGPLPQDAHPRRSPLPREVLLHARRPGLRLGRAARGAHRDARVLGPVVPRSGAPHRARGGAGPLLPDGHRLAVRRGRRRGRRAARRVGDDAARPRHRERRLRRGGEPRGARGRHPLLGSVVRGRSLRARAGARLRRRGGGARRRVRPRRDRAHPPPLAVPARSAHRRVRGPRQTLPRLSRSRVAHSSQSGEAGQGRACRSRSCSVSDDPLRILAGPADASSATAQRAAGERSKPEGRAASRRRAEQYRWPAEWEPHRATWLSWPHNRETWPGRLEHVEAAFCAMVRALEGRETVCINVADAALEERVRRCLRSAGVAVESAVEIHRIATDDAWVRDHRPIFLLRDSEGRRERLLLAFRFDAWGGKYPPWDRDDQVPRRMAESLGLPHRSVDLVLEGGSIDGNGAGTLLTTESCLLHPNRGARRTRETLEKPLPQNLPP